MNIWTAWLQGREAAPNTVKRIFRLWELMNPHCNVHVVTQFEADDILRSCGICQKRITPQVTTNIVRTHLLKVHGGVWVDATLLPTRPLDEWLDEHLRRAGFFAFRSTGDPNLILNTWFLFSEPGNKLITAWHEEYIDYFSKPRLYPTWKRAIWHGRLLDYIRYKRRLSLRDTRWFVDPAGGRGCSFYPYAVINYNLAQVFERQPEIKALFDSVPKKTTSLPALIGHLAGDVETTQETFIDAAREIIPISPVHKLNHRSDRFGDVLDIVEAQCKFTLGRV